MKYVFYDLETTGLDVSKCGVHQISGIILENGEVLDTFDYKVRPFKGALFSPDAMEVGNVKMEDIMKYPEMTEVHDQLVAKLEKYVNRFDKKDKYILAGYNILHFDNEFFRKWFSDCGDMYFGSWFWSCGIDIMSIALWNLANIRPTMKDFKQGTVAKALGIEVDDSKLHDALYDIEICREIAKKILPGTF